MHGLDLNGSSDFADDTTFHTDGVDAVSSMQAIVSPVGAYLTWLGQAVNMLKSKISAINLLLDKWQQPITFGSTGPPFLFNPLTKHSNSWEYA